MSDIWADAKYLGDWGAALTDLSKHLSELNGSPLVLQLDNPDDIEDLTVTVKTDTMQTMAIGSYHSKHRPIG